MTELVLQLRRSQEVMERLGGKIWVESEAGKGSKFFFSLPVVEKHIKIGTKTETEAQRQGKRHKGTEAEGSGRVY